MAINGFDNVHVNDTKHVSLDAYSKAYPMFRRALTVTHVTVIDPGRDLSAITAVLHGTGFVDERVTAISVNGVDALDIRLLSPAAYEFDPGRRAGGRLERHNSGRTFVDWRNKQEN